MKKFVVLGAINCPASAEPCPKVNVADITDAMARLGLDHLGHILLARVLISKRQKDKSILYALQVQHI